MLGIDNPYVDGACTVNLNVIEIFEADPLSKETIDFFEYDMDILKGRKEVEDDTETY